MGRWSNEQPTDGDRKYAKVERDFDGGALMVRLLEGRLTELNVGAEHLAAVVRAIPFSRSIVVRTVAIVSQRQNVAFRASCHAWNSLRHPHWHGGPLYV